MPDFIFCLPLRSMRAPEKKKIFDFSVLQRLFLFVKPYKKYFYLSLLLAIFMAIAAPVRPYLIQLTVNGATGKVNQVPDWVRFVLFGNDLSDVSRFILSVTIFQIGFILIETSIRFLFSYITAWMGQNVVKDLRITVYKKVLGLNLRQFDQTPIGTLTTRTINDIESINEIFSDGLIPIVADLLTIIITLGTMFYMDWKLTLVCLTPFPIMIIATYYFKESVNKSFIQVRNAVAALNAFVQEHITGMQVVQAFAAEEKEARAFQEINKKHRDANIHAIFAYSVFFPVVEVVLALSMGILVWWIADQSLDAGMLVAFILYLNQIFRPLRVIADKFNVLQMGMIAAERVLKVLDNTDELPPSPADAYRPAQIRGDIQFKNVSFSYTGNQNVLHGIKDIVTGKQIGRAHV